MKTLFLLPLLLWFHLQPANTEKAPQKTVTEHFWVNGNCEMCQNRIQKAALTVKGVHYASWDIESKMLTVAFNPKKCSVAQIKKAIADVGHDNDLYKAPNEVYENLHSCCKYERI